MENTSDYLMLGLLLICMGYDKKVCYKVLDNTITRDGAQKRETDRGTSRYIHCGSVKVEKQK